METRSSSASTGSAFGHAGEFLQGAVWQGGELRRILISIPAPALRSNVLFIPSEDDEFTICPAWKKKSLRAFQLAWRQFSDTEPHGRLSIQSDIPVSRGMGSSTADCVAAIKAAASYWNCSLHPDRIALLAHQAECFSDATMYEDRLVVFQHCEGRIYEHLGGAIPNLQLLVVEPEEGASRVDTDILNRPTYSEKELCLFEESLTRFRRATETNDLQEIAAVARISAKINQRYHPKPKRDELERIATETQALGVAVAHSGDIQVILYRPGSLRPQSLTEVSDRLSAIGMRCCRAISTRHEAGDTESCLLPLMHYQHAHST